MNMGNVCYNIENLGYIGNIVCYGNSFGIINRKTDEFCTSYYCDGLASIICCGLKDKKIRIYESGSNGIYGLLLAKDGTLYGGGVNPGTLYAVAPGSSHPVSFTPEGVSYIWDLTETPDGKIYGACYPKAKLWHFDPRTGCCSIDAVLDKDRDYLRYVTTAPDGKIWCSVMHPQLLYVYDPGTGKKQQILPEEFHANSFISKPQVVGNSIFVLTWGTNMPPVLLAFDADSGEIRYRHNLNSYKIRNQPLNFTDEICMVPGNSSGKFYFYNASKGKLFACNAGTGKIEIECQDLYLTSPKWIEDERLLHSINDQDYICYDLKSQSIVNSVRLSPPEKVKMMVYSLCTGPDGDVYGSSFINQHLWKIESVSGKITDMGHHRIGGGQIDSICTGGGKLWMGSYAKAHIASYDPEKRWDIQPGKAQNPRDFGSVMNGQYRTHCILYGPDRQIYMGSYPSYSSGTESLLTALCPETGKIQVIGDYAPQSLASSGCFVCIAGKERFYVYDTEKQSTVYDEQRVISAMLCLPNQKILCSGNNILFFFDPEKMEFSKSLCDIVVGGNADVLIMGKKSGLIFGINESAVFAINMDNSKPEVRILCKPGGKFLAEDRLGNLYFARGPEMFRLVRDGNSVSKSE